MHLSARLHGGLVAAGLLAHGALATPYEPFPGARDGECPIPVAIQPIAIVGVTPVIVDINIPVNTVIIIEQNTYEITNAPTRFATTITKTVTKTVATTKITYVLVTVLFSFFSFISVFSHNSC